MEIKTLNTSADGGGDEIDITDENDLLGQKPTLVLYNTPVLVVKNIEKKGQIKQPATAGGFLDTHQEVEDILNVILPPRCWEENGQLWQQTVSSNPATRQDVINLQELLDMRLQESQARETGICPIRRELYTQCFDELIRQTTINCSERGLLLLRIRDEVEMSIEAYETLYCSSVAFGMRKALYAHEEKENLKDKVKNLEIEKEDLEEIIRDLKLQMEQEDRRNAELRLAEERKYLEEITFLKRTNAQFKAQLEGILSLKK